MRKSPFVTLIFLTLLLVEVPAYNRFVVSWLSPELEVYRKNLQSLTGESVKTTAVNVYACSSTAEFSHLSGLPAWVLAGSRDGMIYLQPLSLMKNRDRTIAHELGHIFLSDYELPYWLEEGLVCVITGEWFGFKGTIMEDFESKTLSDLNRSDYVAYSRTAWIRVCELLRESSFRRLVEEYR